MEADEAERWGFFNRLVEPEQMLDEAGSMAKMLAEGPTFAHAVTKCQLHDEWDMSIDDAIDAEAEAQAVCMKTRDFQRAFEAFAAKQRPKFEGN